jgi:hypothetical protein
LILQKHTEKEVWSQYGIPVSSFLNHESDWWSRLYLSERCVKRILRRKPRILTTLRRFFLIFKTFKINE